MVVLRPASINAYFAGIVFLCATFMLFASSGHAATEETSDVPQEWLPSVTQMLYKGVTAGADAVLSTTFPVSWTVVKNALTPLFNTLKKRIPGFDKWLATPRGKSPSPQASIAVIQAANLLQQSQELQRLVDKGFSSLAQGQQDIRNDLSMMKRDLSNINRKLTQLTASQRKAEQEILKRLSAITERLNTKQNSVRTGKKDTDNIWFGGSSWLNQEEGQYFSKHKWKLIGQEDFSSSNTAWPQGEVRTQGKNLDMFVKDGVYRIEGVIKKPGMRKFDLPYPATINFKVSIDLRFPYFKSNHVMGGIYFGREKKSDYQLIQISDGRYGLTKQYAHGPNSKIINWIPLVIDTRKWNTMEVSVIHKVITVKLNSTVIVEYKANDFVGGLVGVLFASNVADDKAAVEYDNFSYYRLID